MKEDLVYVKVSIRIGQQTEERTTVLGGIDLSGDTRKQVFEALPRACDAAGFAVSSHVKEAKVRAIPELNERRCGAPYMGSKRDLRGRSCDEAPGHAGDHVARGVHGLELGRWSNAGGAS